MSEQLSFLTAGYAEPAVDDIEGVLLGGGQLVRRADAARLSVLARDQWRIDALLAAFADRQLGGETGDRGSVRTDFTAALAPLAARWLRGASRTQPDDLRLDGPRLRMWALAAGSSSDGGYLLRIGDLDPQRILQVAGKAGVAARPVGARAGGPALRVTRASAITRLRELVGPPPPNADWP